MMIEQLREEAMALCRARGVAVHRYAGGWWLVSAGVNRVVGELAGLCNSDLVPLPVRVRQRHQIQPGMADWALCSPAHSGSLDGWLK